MCRLFALHAGQHDVAVEFWLLDAPVSIARQSEFNADGYGMAALTAGRAMMLVRNPVQASEDSAYRHIARRLEACEMMVHLRYANTGGTSLLNTHPFSQDGRLFAHNGVVGDLDQIEARLGSNRAMVMGDTDSERLFALVTLHFREAEGDVRAGLTAAVREVVAEFELYSINFVLAELGTRLGVSLPRAQSAASAPSPARRSER
jgi:predicted glutamine amidotransferase